MKQRVPCETAWISVVCLTGSSLSRRPFESIKCDAKMVFISVDFPRPVCPGKKYVWGYGHGGKNTPTTMTLN
jgi:hypothetical protein